MLIPSSKLIGLPVETQSGQDLGKIDGFNMETDAQTVLQYEVKPGSLIKIFAKHLLISREQVVSINEEKMVVNDNVAKEISEKESAKAAEGVVDSAPNTAIISSKIIEKKYY